MFYLDTQRTITRRDSSLVSKKTSLVSVYDRDPYSPSPTALPDTPQQPRARGSVIEEITNFFFDSMLDTIVGTWNVLEVKRKKEDKVNDRIEKAPAIRQSRKSRVASSMPEPTMLPLEIVWWSTPDEKAVIHFKNGNVYEGELSSKRMHGEGRFQWADGTVYIGQFQDNQITGRGTIEWKDHSWYTGEFVNNLRHGSGLFVDSRLQRCYSGNWYSGAKHGRGTIYFSRNFSNSYEGEWHLNTMHGSGVRDYCAQSVYCGDFEYSIREGKGEVILPNHDYYRGQWKNGIIDGHGYYIWNAIYNKTMSAPYPCSYVGSWFKAQRHGYGILYLGPGLVTYYNGKFEENKKHERSLIVTADGFVASDNNLFENDRFCLENTMYNILQKKQMDKNLSSKITLLLDETRAFRYHIKNAIKYHKKNDHNNRVFIINSFIEKNGLNSSTVLPYDNDIAKISNEDFIDFEDRAMRLIVKRYENNLFEIYRLYTKIYNTKPIYFPAVLIRLYFWQFCYDCNLLKMGFNLTEIDNILFKNKHLIINDPHDPFERIYRWQFIHSLITIACHVYVGNTVPGPKPDTMVASAFCQFMETDVLPNVGSCKGKLMQNSYVPLQPLYKLYRSFEKPRTVRKFLCAVRVAAISNRPQPPLINAEIKHVPRGKNCFLFGDKLIFVREKKTIFSYEADYIVPENLPLFNFGNLSSKSIVKQFANIIPNLMENNKILDIEKEITFYEFFEAFIGCTEESIRVKDEELKWKYFQDGLINSIAI